MIKRAAKANEINSNKIFSSDILLFAIQIIVCTGLEY